MGAQLQLDGLLPQDVLNRLSACLGQRRRAAVKEQMVERVYGSKALELHLAARPQGCRKDRNEPCALKMARDIGTGKGKAACRKHDVVAGGAAASCQALVVAITLQLFDAPNIGDIASILALAGELLEALCQARVQLLPGVANVHERIATIDFAGNAPAAGGNEPSVGLKPHRDTA